LFTVVKSLTSNYTWNVMSYRLTPLKLKLWVYLCRFIDWEKENDVQYYALLAQKRHRWLVSRDWRKKKTAIVVNKPKLLLAHEDDNTTSSLFRVTKKGYSLDLVYI
jgi:hypothetical protein